MHWLVAHGLMVRGSRKSMAHKSSPSSSLKPYPITRTWVTYLHSWQWLILYSSLSIHGVIFFIVPANLQLLSQSALIKFGIHSSHCIRIYWFHSTIWIMRQRPHRPHCISIPKLHTQFNSLQWLDLKKWKPSNHVVRQSQNHGILLCYYPCHCIDGGQMDRLNKSEHKRAVCINGWNQMVWIVNHLFLKFYSVEKVAHQIEGTILIILNQLARLHQRSCT